MRKILFLFILFSAGNIFSQNFTPDNVKGYTGKIYHRDFYQGMLEVQLNADNTYSARYEAEGTYWYNSGKFKLEKGLIRLTPNVCKQFADTDEEVDCSSTLGEAKVDLIKDEYSLYYKEYLLFESRYNKELLVDGKANDNFLLPVPGTQVPEGETRMISKWQVITMGMKKGITISSVKIRTTPEENGEEVLYTPALFEPEQNSVPKNVSVTLVARTTEKQTVNGKEDYWYYVQVGANEGVWMFGGGVKIN